MIADQSGRGQIQIDVAVLGLAERGRPRGVISLGEVKWGEKMGLGHLSRLERACSILAGKGFDTGQTVLACYSGGGFDTDLLARAADPGVLLADPGALYRDVMQ